MEREIIVPLDGSTLAETVLPYAIALARATACHLRLLRIVAAEDAIRTWPPAAPLVTRERWAIEARRAARTYLANVATRLQPSGVEVHREVLAAEDVAVGIVTRATQDMRVAMIAMSTHGRSGLSRWLFGSVAEKVLRAASTPILLVRAGTEVAARDKPVAYGTIAVPLDGSMFADQALSEAQVIATASGATLLLISIVPVVDDPALAEGGIEPLWTLAEREDEAKRITQYLQHKAEYLETQGYRVRTRTAHGAPAEEILRIAGEEHADLIALATHGQGGLQRLWMGSVATRIVQGASVPVLLVRAWEHQSHMPQETSTATGTVHVTGEH